MSVGKTGRGAEQRKEGGMKQRGVWRGSGVRDQKTEEAAQ